MKKKILKIVTFLFILLLLLIILSVICNPKNNTKEAGMHDLSANGILAEEENTIDIITVGDSESMTSVIPMELWKNYGYTNYICGTAGQSVTESLKMTYRVTKKQKPKFIMLETNTIYCSLSVANPAKRVAEYVLPITEYHDRWKNLNKEDFYKKPEYTGVNDLKGYNYSTEVCSADSSNYMTYTEEKTKIPTLNKLYIKVLNEYCKENDISLILLSTPSTKNWDYKKHNSMKEFADKERIEFLDLNVFKDEINIDWSTETRDAGDHLNYKGAQKVTEYVGKYFKDKNVLQDHRKDEKYKQWNETLERVENK